MRRRDADRVAAARQRYVEKLATPDVTIADIIGDVDPIKAARGGHVLSDELTIHYGMLPRANRGIFALNELPDLRGKVQVGLFNIMQEGDVQIKGYPVRLPLDVLLCFTANPEDYTARGKIITPLKDRIGSEIITHYPETVELGMEITAQEAWTERGGRPVRRAGLHARSDGARRLRGAQGQAHGQAIRRVPAHADHRAGERDLECRAPRGHARRDRNRTPRQRRLCGAAGHHRQDRARVRGRAGGRRQHRARADPSCGRPRLDERLGGADLAKIVAWFDQGGALKVAGDERTELCHKGFSVVPGLLEVVSDVGLSPRGDTALAVAACELVLEGLAAHKRISRSEELGYTRLKPERRDPGYGKGGISFG